MGDFYRMGQSHVKNLLMVLSESNVSGAEAHKVVAINEILTSKGIVSSNSMFYKFDDILADYIHKMLDQILIKGAFALQIVQLQLIFREGLNEIPPAPPAPPAPPTSP